jgi:hypothetical protein
VGAILVEGPNRLTNFLNHPMTISSDRRSTKMAAKLKIEKRRDEIKKKLFSSETVEPISTKLC